MLLDKEYKFYLDNKEAFLKEYKGKVLVIRGEGVVGVYGDEASAYKDSVTKYKLGTFLIQACMPDSESIQSFHSRVVFS